MIKIALLCLVAVAVYGHPADRYGYHEPRYGYGYAAPVKVVKIQKVEKPSPYEFSYDIKNDYHDSFGRQESGDAHGNKKGSYQIQLANGLRRWVSYVADEGGFRAKIDTNEPGTDSQDPADVHIDASPIVVKEAPKRIIKKVILTPTYYAPAHRYY